MGHLVCTLLDILVAKREPTPVYDDVYSVGTPKWASFWRNTGRKTVRPHFLPQVGVLVSKRTIFYFFTLGGGW